MQYKYYKIYKPYGMLSQFTPEGEHDTLASLFEFPKDVYPIGRLDHDSEGLLLLTNDKAVNLRLLNPGRKHMRTYWIQVEGTPDNSALSSLRNGVTINLKGTLHQTLPAVVRTISSPALPERNPSVNYLKHPITSWLQVSISEGKNRQIRKMTAKVGHPTLRLIRFAIEKINITKMIPGDIVELTKHEFYDLLLLRP
ncbi:MAG: pseudouridine synthase [Chitinophagales bacterium]|jgi:23S rRNA pseudouridine2457 synthase|nr:pseudouridine synthase [Chitinophagales bacterium]